MDIGATDIIKVGTIIITKRFMVEINAESDIPTNVNNADPNVIPIIRCM